MAAKVLLIFDGTSSHLHPGILDAATASNVALFCLPSNTTHELQPRTSLFLDHLNIIGMWKS